MAKEKKIMTYIKLQVPAGAASPSPPVGPALGQHGVNLMDFCNAFNSKTNELEKNVPVPVVISVYEDRSFDFIIKTTPASILLKKLDYFDDTIKQRNQCATYYTEKLQSLTKR